MLERISSYTNILVIGDINIHLDDVVCTNNQKIRTLLTSLGLQDCISQPTHIRGHQLDIFAISGNDPAPYVRVDPPSLLSDHSLIVVSLSSAVHDHKTSERVRRKWSTFNIDKFSDDLAVSDLVMNTPSDVNDLFRCYDDTLSSLLDKHAPLRPFTFRSDPSAPWYDTECRRTKRHTRKLERIFRSKPSNESRDAWRLQFKLQRSIFQTKFREFWSRTIESCH